MAYGRNIASLTFFIVKLRTNHFCYQLLKRKRLTFLANLDYTESDLHKLANVIFEITQKPLCIISSRLRR